jgi:hypothetical protein
MVASGMDKGAIAHKMGIEDEGGTRGNLKESGRERIIMSSQRIMLNLGLHPAAGKEQSYQFIKMANHSSVLYS